MFSFKLLRPFRVIVSLLSVRLLGLLLVACLLLAELAELLPVLRNLHIWFSPIVVRDSSAMLPSCFVF